MNYYLKEHFRVGELLKSINKLLKNSSSIQFCPQPGTDTYKNDTSHRSVFFFIIIYTYAFYIVTNNTDQHTFGQTPCSYDRQQSLRTCSLHCLS